MTPLRRPLADIVDLADAARQRRAEEHTSPIAIDANGETRPGPIGAVLRMIDAACAPNSFRLKRGACVVGAAHACDLSVLEPTVSRTHVELALAPEGVVVRDLGSRNGTFYLGRRVEKVVVPLGGRITLGAVTLAIDADAEALANAGDHAGGSYRGLTGVSRAMRRLFAMLVRLEGSLASVLVSGEAGTGKEIFGRTIHEGSSVAAGPFVSVACASRPRDALALDRAIGGTLFLDEIGELPREIQDQLLRALDKRDANPAQALGERPSVRVIASTTKNLEAMAREKRFRRDLFHRVAAVELAIPPLRERAEDIEPLARRFAAALGLSGIQRSVMVELKSRTWPGNVRELENEIQSYAALGQVSRSTRAAAGDAIDQGFADLVDVRRPYADQRDAVVARFTKIYLKALLEHANDDADLASKLAGVDRVSFGTLLAKHGLAKEPAAPSRPRGQIGVSTLNPRPK